MQGTDHMALKVPRGPTMDGDKSLCLWPPVRPSPCSDQTQGHDEAPGARGPGEAAQTRLRGGRPVGAPTRRSGLNCLWALGVHPV